MKKILIGLSAIVFGANWFINGCMVDTMKQEANVLRKHDQEIRKILEIGPKDNYAVSDLGDRVYVLVSGEKGSKEILYHDKDGSYQRTTSSLTGKLKPLGIIPGPNEPPKIKDYVPKKKKKTTELLVYKN